MTRKLSALLVATLVLFATPLAGTAVAANAGNTTGNTIDETAGNDSKETAGNDSAGNDTAGPALPFGLQVTSFVDSAKETESGTLGPLVAAFVTENNPGNAPDHAGPPSWLFGGDEINETEDNDTDTRGPPEDAGPPGNSERGPPEDAGPSGDTERGPPDDRGPNSDEQGDDQRDEDENDHTDRDAEDGDDDGSDDDGEEDDDETDSEDDDERRGPPERAGPPASAGPP